MATAPPQLRLFDSHLHIIDKRFPLVANQGYLPDSFDCQDYLAAVEAYTLEGGALVSGSFQAYDQSYLISALQALGPAFVGVTQLPHTVTDQQILDLHSAGVRAVRFNLKRGGSEEVRHLDAMARRIHDVAGWHIELYVDAAELQGLAPTLTALPAVSIDHLGLSIEGLKLLCTLAEKGCRVKATGFGRLNFDPQVALRDIYKANPAALMFGTDLPSTRAPRPYVHTDYELVEQCLGQDGAQRVWWANAVDFYMGRAS